MQMVFISPYHHMRCCQKNRLFISRFFVFKQHSTVGKDFLIKTVNINQPQKGVHHERNEKKHPGIYKRI